MNELRDLLPLYALGVLEADEATEVQRAVSRDPQLAAELEALQAAAAHLAPSVTPSADVETRLVASVGGGRFERFATRLGSLFDVDLGQARALLGLIERPASWAELMPGIALVHFAGGPACAEADCGFVRIEAGATFPWHKHLGDEVSLVMSGTLRDRSGRLVEAGDELLLSSDTEHDFTAVGGELIFAARAMNGIEVGGVRAKLTR